MFLLIAYVTGGILGTSCWLQQIETGTIVFPSLYVLQMVLSGAFWDDNKLMMNNNQYDIPSDSKIHDGDIEHNQEYTFITLSQRCKFR